MIVSKIFLGHCYERYDDSTKKATTDAVTKFAIHCYENYFLISLEPLML